MEFSDISDYGEAARARGKLTQRAAGVSDAAQSQKNYKKRDRHSFVYEDAIQSSSWYESEEHDGFCAGKLENGALFL